jgi:hypothetical protein
MPGTGRRFPHPGPAGVRRGGHEQGLARGRGALRPHDRSEEPGRTPRHRDRQHRRDAEARPFRHRRLLRPRQRGVDAPQVRGHQRRFRGSGRRPRQHGHARHIPPGEGRQAARKRPGRRLRGDPPARLLRDGRLGARLGRGQRRQPRPSRVLPAPPIRERRHHVARVAPEPVVLRRSPLHQQLHPRGHPRLLGQPGLHPEPRQRLHRQDEVRHRPRDHGGRPLRRQQRRRG